MGTLFPFAVPCSQSPEARCKSRIPIQGTGDRETHSLQERLCQVQKLRWNL
jgi:hypothetical protein